MTKKIGTRLLTIAIVMMVLLSACGGKNNTEEEDPNAAVTQVFETAMAALTMTSAVQSPTPTNTEIPTATTTSTLLPTMAATATTGSTVPTATTGTGGGGSTNTCDIASFVSDVTIPDGTSLSPGESFTKTWSVKNTGSCTWDGTYQLVYYGGDLMSAEQAVDFPEVDVAPGETGNVSVDFVAPTASGTYTSYWVFRNGSSQNFYIDGGSIYVQIKVGTSGTAAPTATGPTSTPAPTTNGTATATVDATAAANNVPTVSISNPSNGDTYKTSDEITFSGTASDKEDGNLNASIKWSSSLDGDLGTGKEITSKLSAGTHTIIAMVTDSGGKTRDVSVTITVN